MMDGDGLEALSKRAQILVQTSTHIQLELLRLQAVFKAHENWC